MHARGRRNHRSPHSTDPPVTGCVGATPRRNSSSSPTHAPLAAARHKHARSAQKRDWSDRRRRANYKLGKLEARKPSRRRRNRHCRYRTWSSSARASTRRPASTCIHGGQGHVEPAWPVSQMRGLEGARVSPRREPSGVSESGDEQVARVSLGRRLPSRWLGYRSWRRRGCLWPAAGSVGHRRIVAASLRSGHVMAWRLEHRVMRAESIFDAVAPRWLLLTCAGTARQARVRGCRG